MRDKRQEFFNILTVMLKMYYEVKIDEMLEHRSHNMNGLGAEIRKVESILVGENEINKFLPELRTLSVSSTLRADDNVWLQVTISNLDGDLVKSIDFPVKMRNDIKKKYVELHRLTPEYCEYEIYETAIKDAENKIWIKYVVDILYAEISIKFKEYLKDVNSFEANMINLVNELNTGLFKADELEMTLLGADIVNQPYHLTYPEKIADGVRIRFMLRRNDDVLAYDYKIIVSDKYYYV